MIKYEDSFVTDFWLTDTFDDIESTGLRRHQMCQTKDNTLEDTREKERAEGVACITAADKAGLL